MIVIKFLIIIISVIMISNILFEATVKDKVSAQNVERIEYLYSKFFEVVKLIAVGIIKATKWFICAMGEEAGIISKPVENNAPIIQGTRTQINDIFVSILEGIVDSPCVTYIHIYNNVARYEISYIPCESLLYDNDITKKIRHKVCSYLNNTYNLNYDFFKENIEVRNMRELSKIQIIIPHNDTGCMQISEYKKAVIRKQKSNTAMEERWDENGK